MSHKVKRQFDHPNVSQSKSLKSPAHSHVPFTIRACQLISTQMCLWPATPTFLLFLYLASNWHESKPFSFITWQILSLPTQTPFYLAKEIQGNLGLTYHSPTPLTQRKNPDSSKLIMVVAFSFTWVGLGMACDTILVSEMWGEDLGGSWDYLPHF